VYKFNKNLFFETNIKNKLVNQIINSYFNSKPESLINVNIENLEYMWLNKNMDNKEFMSLKRIFNSLHIKHNVNNILITIYNFNKEKLYLLNQLNKWFSSLDIIKHKKWYNNFIIQGLKFKSKNIRYKKLKKTKKINLFKNFKYITFKNRPRKFIVKNKRLFLFNRFKYIKITSIIKGLISKLFFKMYNYKKLNLFFFEYMYIYLSFNDTNKNNIIYNLSLNIFNDKFKNIYLYKFYISMLYINNIKYSVINMVNLKGLLSKIYNKKININIIKLKYLFLDNSILTDAVVRKLNDRNKRVLKVIRKFFKLIKIAKLNRILYKSKTSDFNLNYNKEINNKILLVNKHNAIINNLHHKYLTGIKLQGNGRLTKRLTASRSILKQNSKGRLKDIISSFQKKSSVILKGYMPSSMQYLNINSYNRNGSFGIKGWLTSY
jgi:hypothetical protein